MRYKDWVVLKLLLKAILFMQFSGVLESLLFLGVWWIVWRKLRIFQDSSEANAMVDALAKEGILRSSSSFDD